MRTTVAAIAGTLIFCVTITAAQQADPSSAAARAKLQFLVGNFTTSTAMPASAAMPKGATGTGTSVIGWSLDSMFLMIDEQSVNSVFGAYKGHGMLGYSPQTKKYELSMFNNFGDHPTYTGTFSGDTLVLGTTVANPGRSFEQRLLWYKSGNTVTMRVMNDAGKGFAPVLEESATPVKK